MLRIVKIYENQDILPVCVAVVDVEENTTNNVWCLLDEIRLCGSVVSIDDNSNCILYQFNTDNKFKTEIIKFPTKSVITNCMKEK